MAKLYINEKNKKGHINPELYGNFSEHLGRCIYEGLYVGEDSDIPNTNACMYCHIMKLIPMLNYNQLGW